MSRSRVQRYARRRKMLGAAGFAALVAGMVGPAGGASASAIGISTACAAQGSQVVCAIASPQAPLGIRWQ